MRAGADRAERQRVRAVRCGHVQGRARHARVLGGAALPGQLRVSDDGHGKHRRVLVQCGILGACRRRRVPGVRSGELQVEGGRWSLHQLRRWQVLAGRVG